MVGVINPVIKHKSGQAMQNSINIIQFELLCRSSYIGISWRPPSLSELTLMLSNMGLTHLGSEASNYYFNSSFLSTYPLSWIFNAGNNK